METGAPGARARRRDRARPDRRRRPELEARAGIAFQADPERGQDRGVRLREAIRHLDLGQRRLGPRQESFVGSPLVVRRDHRPPASVRVQTTTTDRRESPRPLALPLRQQRLELLVERVRDLPVAVAFACGSPAYLGEQNHVHRQALATFTGSSPRPGTTTVSVKSSIWNVAATSATRDPGVGVRGHERRVQRRPTPAGRLAPARDLPGRGPRTRGTGRSTSCRRSARPGPPRSRASTMRVSLVCSRGSRSAAHALSNRPVSGLKHPWSRSFAPTSSVMNATCPGWACRKATAASSCDPAA